MATYDDIITRGSPSDPLIPESIVNTVIETMPEQSVVLSRARRVQMTSKSGRQPVLSALPAAYWVNGDAGMKQTTKAEWDNVTITAEELAAIVVIPDAYFDDASIPLWDQIRPLLTEAIGLKVDQAALFGTDAPASWPDGIVPAAVAAGNEITAGTGDDFGVDVASLGEVIAAQGFSINGFAARPGLQWRLVGLRNEQGTPIYTPSLSAGAPSGLYGYPLNEVRNGAWDPAYDLLAADWSKFVVGIRQDITFRIFSEGVISDDSGNVVVNLMQQDAKAMRVVFRVGFATANPLTRLESDEDARYPAGVIASASGS
jgi:HK97 family phage major capsid protein